MSNELNIYQRLSRVRENVAYLKKDAEVQGYKAVTHDMVTASVREHLIKHGILVVPRQTGGRCIELKTQRGGYIVRYEAQYEVDFINIDKPEDKVTVPIEAHAMDQGDKAPGKSLSYAVKYAFLKLFNIETGESDEGRIEMFEDRVDKMHEGVIKAIEKGDWAYLSACDRAQEEWLAVWGKMDTHKKSKIKKLMEKKDEYRDNMNDFASRGDKTAVEQLWDELDKPQKEEVWRGISDESRAMIREIRNQQEKAA